MFAHYLMLKGNESFIGQMNGAWDAVAATDSCSNEEGFSCPQAKVVNYTSHLLD
jgi:hypothetical protein